MGKRIWTTLRFAALAPAYVFRRIALVRASLLPRIRLVLAVAGAAARIAWFSRLGPALRVRGVFAFVNARLRTRSPGGPVMALQFHARNTPDKIAILDGGKRVSYRQLDTRVNQLAHALAMLGAGPGQRVAIMMRNRHEYIEVQWAAARLGAVAVQIGRGLKPAETAWILENSEPCAFVYEADVEDVALDAHAQAGYPRGGAEALLVVGAAPTARAGGPSAAFPPPPASRDYETVLAAHTGIRPPVVGIGKGGLLIYTSGTTGRVKGASRDFSSLLQPAVLDLVAHIQVHHGDRHLVVCPLYHAGASVFVGLTLGFGGTCVLAEHFEPKAVLDLIEREHISTSFMVPTQLLRLTEVPEADRANCDRRSLRWLIAGAAPLPTETARRVEAAFGPVLWNFYGATETGAVTLARPGEHTARPGTIGRALLGNDIRLLDDLGHEVPIGQPGELWTKSSMLVDGYFRDQDATTRACKDGYFSVGDVARVDSDGYYYLVDRKADIVISGGVNIYPFEIERLLETHPQVADVAIIGVPDPDWGESLHAIVVPRAGHAPVLGELQRFCRAHLANYKCPKSLELTDALPRSPAGKILKRELRDRQRNPPPGP